MKPCQVQSHHKDSEQHHFQILMDKDGKLEAGESPAWQCLFVLLITSLPVIGERLWAITISAPATTDPAELPPDLQEAGH